MLARRGKLWTKSAQCTPFGPLALVAQIDTHQILEGPFADRRLLDCLHCLSTGDFEHDGTQIMCECLGRKVQVGCPDEGVNAYDGVNVNTSDTCVYQVPRAANDHLLQGTPSPPGPRSHEPKARRLSPKPCSLPHGLPRLEGSGSICV